MPYKKETLETMENLQERLHPILDGAALSKVYCSSNADRDLLILRCIRSIHVLSSINSANFAAVTMSL
jgi:hypothetical protein